MLQRGYCCGPLQDIFYLTIKKLAKFANLVLVQS